MRIQGMAAPFTIMNKSTATTSSTITKLIRISVHRDLKKDIHEVIFLTFNLV